MSDATNTKALVPGAETCGCCAGIEERTPGSIDNRIGLSAIAYRIGEYDDFRQSMLAGLSSSQFGELAGLRTRDADDYSIALIDAFACAADVLSFYQERLANESYLRTATERVSMQEMGKLIGYRLRPGVAAETWLAFALETPRTPPPALPPEPGAFVTGIPASLALDAGVKVQSVPGPNEKPQTFETVEDLAARPEWNAIRPWLSEARSPGFGATETWLAGVRNNLKPGDALVFVGDAFLANPATNNNWDFRLVDAVEMDPANDRTRVRWKRPLGSVSPFSNPASPPVQVHALRKRTGAFGNNAPLWRSLNSQFRSDYSGGSPDLPDWPSFTISPLAASASGGHIDLDSVQSEVATGGFVVLAKGEFNRPDESFPPGTYVELYVVTSTTDVSRAEFAISAKVTRLGVTGQNLPSQFFGFVRETSVYAQSERLALAPHPVVDPVVDEALPLAIGPEGLTRDRKLIVTGTAAYDGRTRIVHRAVVVSALANANGAMVSIAPPLAQALVRSSVVVHANVALATHGETVAQILGAGDAAARFQRFELKRTPLTYRSAATDTGADSELTVRIGDVAWTEKPTLFGAAPAERAYTLVDDEQGRTYVVFGDGEHGARLPSGVNNVRASYRQGLGKDGNVASDALTQLLSRPLGLKSVSNPIEAEGGTDPEPPGQARSTMPLFTRTLGRAVSLLDYEDFALAFTGIAKAQAAIVHLASGRAIAITLAGQDGAVLSADNPVRANLLAALGASGDPHVQIVLLSYQPSAFRLGLKVKRDPAYALAPLLAAVETALRARYAFDARALGQPVLESDVIATVHSVPGVVALDLDFLYGGSAPLAQTVKSRQTRLLASRMRVDNGVALPSELLTLSPDPFDRLEEFQ